MKLGIITIVALFSLACWKPTQPQQSMPSQKIKIEIWSDVVCPFCYLGKKKLEQAISHLQAEDQVEIVWHSFQLDPGFPKGISMPSQQYLAERKGYPLDQLQAVSAQLAQQGRGYGIDFQFDKALTFNTWDAHRLIQWAKPQGQATALKEALMRSYFSGSKDLSDHQNLLKVVAELGLDASQAKAVLQGDAFNEQVQQDINRSRQLGIQGVPFFLIDGKKAISGAQPDAVFQQALSEALKGEGVRD
jgi:predicted DsbA family dithiol-disulfide isomerase